VNSTSPVAQRLNATLEHNAFDNFLGPSFEKENAMGMSLLTVEDGAVLSAGTTLPADDTVGYARGGIFLLLDAAENTEVAYVNIGDSTECEFVQVLSEAHFNVPNGVLGLDGSGAANAKLVPRSGDLASLMALVPTPDEPSDGEIVLVTDPEFIGRWNGTLHTVEHLSDSSIEDYVVAYWPLHEATGDRYDQSGNGHKLADNNSVTSEAGQCGLRAKFTAANTEWLQCSSTTALESGDVHLTIVLLARFASFPSSTNLAMLVSKDVGTDGSSTPEYAISIVDNSAVAFAVTNGAVSGVAPKYTSLSTGVTYFICGQHDPVANEVRVSITPITADFVSSPTVETHTGGILAHSNQSLRLGAHQYGACLDGTLEEVAIIKNRPVSAREIERFFQRLKAGRGLFGS
jgi:hypothetical protein